MPDYTATDWYRFPDYYDIVFDGDTPREADFLEAVFARHGTSRHDEPLRILEPACGSGRLMVELARRGHRVAGFDLSPEMVAYAKGRLAGEIPAVRRAVRVSEDRMESFRLRGPFDLVHCLLSTFKYLLSEDAAFACLSRIARVLAPGGLCVLGIHLTDYQRTRTDREIWHGVRDGVKVDCETITRPADAATRLEGLRNRLTVRHHGRPGMERLETQWQCRTYDAAELTGLLARVGELERVAYHDFTHDIDATRGFDDTQEDIVVVLRKRGSTGRAGARTATAL